MAFEVDGAARSLETHGFCRRFLAMICELFDFEREMDGFLFWRETKLLKGELTYQSFSLMVIQFSPQFGFVDNILKRTI